MVDSWNAAILNEAVQNGGGATGHDELSEMRDVTITTPASGEVLSYNGSKWVNETLEASDIVYDNSDVDTVLDALSDSDEYTCPSTYGSYIFLKRGNVVTLRVLNPTGVTSNQFTDVDTIPAKYRPKYELRFTMGATQPLGVYLRADLLADGTFKVYNYNQETTTFVCGETFTYVV